MKKKLCALSITLILATSGNAFATELNSTDATRSDAHQMSSQKASESNPNQPYAGYQERKIKALPPEKIENLSLGKGAGYALAGELNHFPGPKHVLEFSTQLNLTAIQLENIKKQSLMMDEEAKILGEEFIQLETTLDQEFSDGLITDKRLSELTNGIGIVEGKLRYTHLKYHLMTKSIMSKEQIEKYDELRGYTNKLSDQIHEEQATQQSPININGNQYVPLRKVAEKQGATLQWDNEMQTATIVRKGITAIIKINSKEMILNGDQKLMNAAPILQNDITLIPVEYVSAIMGAGNMAEISH